MNDCLPAVLPVDEGLKQMAAILSGSRQIRIAEGIDDV
jgi:hypothetical protein